MNVSRPRVMGNKGRMQFSSRPRVLEEGGGVAVGRGKREQKRSS